MVKCRFFEGRPYVSLLVRSPGQSEWVIVPDVLVDTGADVTHLPGWVAKTLDLDLAACEETQVRGIGGTVTAYLATVEIAVISLGSAEEDVSGYILGSEGKPYYFSIPALVIPGDQYEDIALLGRTGVLRHLKILFEEERLVTIKLKEH